MIVIVKDGFTVKLCNTHCLFTVKTILISYRLQNYVNIQWVLHNSPSIHSQQVRSIYIKG